MGGHCLSPGSHTFPHSLFLLPPSHSLYLFLLSPSPSNPFLLLFFLLFLHAARRIGLRLLHLGSAVALGVLHLSFSQSYPLYLFLLSPSPSNPFLFLFFLLFLHGPSSSGENRNSLACLVVQGKIGTLLLASEMPVPIPRSRTVQCRTTGCA